MLNVEQATAIKLVIAGWILATPAKTEFYLEELAEEVGKRTGSRPENITNDMLIYCEELVYIGTLWSTKKATVFTVVHFLPFIRAAREADENAATI